MEVNAMADYTDLYPPISIKSLSTIPAAMKAAARWVVWGGKKIPVNGNAQNREGFYVGADATDPAAWMTYDAAAALIGAACLVRGEYFHVAGVGFVVGDGWFCIDADGGQAHGREPVPDAVISDLCRRSGTYAEMSISSNGCHVFGRCDFVTEDGKEHFSESKTSYEIEFFTRRKFLIVTGNHVPGSAEDIAECSDAAREIYIQYVLSGCNAREAEERRQREERRATITIDPNDAEQFFLLNYPDILSFADVDHFKRGGKGGPLSPGEYSWIGAIKAMDEIGIPRSAIYDWCRRGASFAGERDIDRVLDEKRSSAQKSSTASIVKDALENGWRPDPDKLTGEAKRNHDQKVYEEEQLRIFQEEHREQNAAALAAVGIDCGGDPYRFAWKRNFDGLITEVMDKETGEIVYKAPAADPEQPVPGETVHTGPGASDPQKDKPHLTVSGYEDVEIKPIDFMFFPWFPRGYITAIQGDSGSSKSTFMYAIGAAVSTGADLLGVPCEDPGNVMFITLEDDASDIKVAFQDAGGDLSKLFRIREREEIAKINLSPAGVKMLDKIVKGKNIKLLVLDPIQQFLGNDMNKASDTRPQMARLMNIAAENNICVVIIEHLGKDATKSAQHRALGSVDINASTRSQLQVVTDPEDNFFKILFTVKSNLAAFQDVQRAIRYQVKDHPGSYDTEKKKRARFRGHAEFTGIIPEYNERLYKKAQRKADEEAEEEILLAFEYEKDPLVLTVREIVAQNPQGVFIGTDDLIQRITQVCGRCPYDQTKSKATGIYARIAKLRSMIIDNDGIQVDKKENSFYPKAYQWRGELTEPAHTRTKGIVITPVTAAKQGFQQTKI